MLASELVTKLIDLIDAHGNLEVIVCDDEADRVFTDIQFNNEDEIGVFLIDIRDVI